MHMKRCGASPEPTGAYGSCQSSAESAGTDGDRQSFMGAAGTDRDLPEVQANCWEPLIRRTRQPETPKLMRSRWVQLLPGAYEEQAGALS